MGNERTTGRLRVRSICPLTDSPLKLARARPVGRRLYGIVSINAFTAVNHVYRPGNVRRRLPSNPNWLLNRYYVTERVREDDGRWSRTCRNGLNDRWPTVPWPLRPFNFGPKYGGGCDPQGPNRSQFGRIGFWTLPDDE